VNGSDYCWIEGSTGERGTETAFWGAYLFPIIQHYNKDCYNCTKGKPSKNNKDCNELDLEYLLFFNTKLASVPHYVHTFNATWRETRRPYTMDNSGLDGAIYMNMYGGVKFLNELFYELPNLHCTKPIAIAKGLKAKNSMSCGSNYQKGLVKSKKGRIRKAAQKTYCYTPPVQPQETYFQCWYSDQECVSAAIAEASGQSELVGSILSLFVFSIAVYCMGFPARKSDKSLMQKLFPRAELDDVTREKFFKKKIAESADGADVETPAKEVGGLSLEDELALRMKQSAEAISKAETAAAAASKAAADAAAQGALVAEAAAKYNSTSSLGASGISRSYSRASSNTSIYEAKLGSPMDA